MSYKIEEVYYFISKIFLLRKNEVRASYLLHVKTRARKPRKSRAAKYIRYISGGM